MLVKYNSSWVFQTQPKSSELDKYRAEFHLEKKTLTSMLRKPSDPDQKANGDKKCRAVRLLKKFS